MFRSILFWFQEVTGSDSVKYPVIYGFWSGFGSGGPWFAGILTLLHVGNCNVKGCWRVGRHKTAAGHRTCLRHHPTGGLTEEHIADAHHSARGS